MLEHGLQLSVSVRDRERVLSFELLASQVELPVEHAKLAPAQVQLDEEGDFAAKDLRDHRHRDIVDGADFVTLQVIELRNMNTCDEDDRNALQARMLPNEPGKLESVHFGHMNVENEHGKLFFEQPLKGIFARACAHTVEFESAQYRFVSQQASRLVVDEQHACARRRRVAKRRRRCGESPSKLVHDISFIVGSPATP